VGDWLRGRFAFGPDVLERARVLREGYAVRRLALAEQTQPLTALVRRVWPDVKFYLGILTTLLVGIAWCTNLIAKPLATEFGGGLTVLGVAIAVIHYRYQQRIGEQPVFPMAILRRIPGSLLVVLTAQSPYNEQVIRAACETADNHYIPVFLYEGTPEQRSLHVMQFNDPYLYDRDAQRTFSMAARICRQESVRSAYYIYRVGGTASIINVWRIIRPEEIIAEASVAKALSKQVSPEYVRFQQVDGVRVAHYIRHFVSTLETPPEGATGTTAPPLPRRERTSDGATAATEASARRTTNGTRPAGSGSPTQGHTARRTPPPAIRETHGPRMPAPEERNPREDRAQDEGTTTEAQTAESAASPTDIANYVWTGTQLVRKDELEQSQQPGQSTQEQPKDE
jgi:hypothetical protein